MSQFVPDKLVKNSIRRTIYNSKIYSLQLYIPPTDAIYSPNSYQVSTYGILYLALPYLAKPDGLPQKNDRSFSIRQNNYRRVLRAFDRALRWFEDESFSDLYITTNDRIMLNTTYNDIHILYQKTYMETQSMKIVPITIEYAYGKFQEGVRIYINRLENFMELTVDQLQELFDLLMGFDISKEVTQAYIALWHAHMTKNITDQESYRNRMIQSN